MLAVALTGGIGSGKSAVSRHLETLGVPVIDADLLARQMVEPGSSALQEIQTAFGDEVLDQTGGLNRQALRDIIFEHPDQRSRLEAILHPRIRQAMLEWLAQQKAPYAVLVVPLLFETGQNHLADRVLVVDCEPRQQIHRVRERDGLSLARIEQILEAQMDRQTRLQGADDIIENNGTLEELIAATEAVHQRYLELAAT
jgi:dephospho-CoA kinase